MPVTDARLMQRAGHQTFTTTLGYIRTAEAVGLNVGEPFPPLPRVLIGSGSRADDPRADDSGDELARRTNGRAMDARDEKRRPLLPEDAVISNGCRGPIPPQAGSLVIDGKCPRLHGSGR